MPDEFRAAIKAAGWRLAKVSHFHYYVFLCWLAASLSVVGATPPAAKNVSPVARVVWRYALTSANDFPQRDPFDWRLLASNDGGKTWTTLDTRKGELFSERHQRRVFQTANHSAFNLYRLQIDRVRDPVAAHAVQLAEIEPLGEPGDESRARPIFADLITAQDDNPPVETAFQAFDGRPETKWLDAVDRRTSWIQWQYQDKTGLVITNLNDLHLLGGEARDGFPVRIAGVFVGPGSASNTFVVLDLTGHIQISDAEPAPPSVPGQRVLLEGRSQWVNHQIQIEHPTIVAQGPAAPPKPGRIALGQSFSPAEDYSWVEVEGSIRFLTRTQDGAELELVDNERSLSVHLLSSGEIKRLPPVGVRVRLQGVCTGALNTSGERVAATLWTSGLDSLSLADPTEASTGLPMKPGTPDTNSQNPTLLTDIQQIQRLNRETLIHNPRVRIRGVLTEMFGTFMQQGNVGIELINPEGATFQARNLGAYVEVEGTAGWGRARGPMISAETVRVFGEGKLPEPERPSWTQLANGQMNAQWVEIEAVVRATDGSHLSLDHEGRQMMATIRSASASEVEHLVDASVVLRGVCVNATDDRGIVQGVQLVVPSLDFVMIKEPAADPWSIPLRPLSSLNRIGSPTESSHRVRIKATLAFQEGRKFFLQQSTNGSGLAVARAGVMLDEPANGSRWVFWQTPETDISGPVGDFSPGDEVEVVGFPETHGYAPMLTEALVRKVGRSNLAPPMAATAQDLVMGRLDSTVVSLEGLMLGQETLGGHFIMQVQSGQKIFHAVLPVTPRGLPAVPPGSLVRLTGICQMEQVAHSELGKSPSAFSILLRTPADVVVLESPSWWTVTKALILVGALLLVLLAAMVWIRMLHRTVEERTSRLKQEITDHERTENRLAEETKLLQQEIEEHQRTEASLAEKTRLLGREIEEREVLYERLAEKTVSLEREIEERKRAQAEVERIHKQLLSASRLAGMAEVATNVLHNVGNVLNSVNVLASSIATQVQKSKMPGVARLAALLARHQTDLGRFMTEDENGRHVPGHLERLGDHLIAEQVQLQEKAKLLTESIQHIKEIVAMQQNYAKVAGVYETLPVTEIVEDALRMCSGALARHEINVVRDYEPLPAATLDRHKVLQILVNLLDNAKHACEASGSTGALVTIRARRTGPKKIQIQVMDNGTGIAPENLTRIFTQGFSTRKNGHGFGLHGSILAAQDMGGALQVESAGPGRGATFTLELPCDTEESAVTVAGDSQIAVAARS